jgi:hypothetical protein
MQYHRAARPIVVRRGQDRTGSGLTTSGLGQSAADQAERALRNLARRLEQDAPGVSASILEGIDEMLTVSASVRLISCCAPMAALTLSRV